MKKEETKPRAQEPEKPQFLDAVSDDDDDYVPADGLRRAGGDDDDYDSDAEVSQRRRRRWRERGRWWAGSTGDPQSSRR